jgi:tricorn protease
MRRILITLILALAPIFASAQSGNATLFRQPTINKNEIVFVYANDLWRVSRNGGNAERLTSNIGTESNPIFSPDGEWIAFTGEYDGTSTSTLLRRAVANRGASRIIPAGMA